MIKPFLNESYNKSFNTWIYKKNILWNIFHKKSVKYYPRSFEHFGGNVKVESDLTSYAAKADLKG